jgi:hypothetical protein
MPQRVILMLLSAAILAVAGSGYAQDRYPSRAIKVMVPYNAGSATDITIRIVGEAVRKSTGHGFLVENKPGAFGILAQEEMLKAPADGYTLQVGNAATNALAPIIYKSKYKFDYDKEITMVTRVGEIPLLLSGTTVDFPPKTFAEFVAYGKANPGKLRYASVGPGSNNHYDTEAIMRWAGLQVPEQGRRRRHYQRRAARRRPRRAGECGERGRTRAIRQDQGIRGDRRQAPAGLPQRADDEGIGLHLRRAAVVGALCPREDAEDRA